MQILRTEGEPFLLVTPDQLLDTAVGVGGPYSVPTVEVLFEKLNEGREQIHIIHRVWYKQEWGSKCSGTALEYIPILEFGLGCAEIMGPQDRETLLCYGLYNTLKGQVGEAKELFWRAQPEATHWYQFDTDRDVTTIYMRLGWK